MIHPINTTGALEDSHNQPNSATLLVNTQQRLSEKPCCWGALIQEATCTSKILELGRPYVVRLKKNSWWQSDDMRYAGLCDVTRLDFRDSQGAKTAFCFPTRSGGYRASISGSHVDHQRLVPL